MDKFLTLTVTGLCAAGAFAIAASGLVVTYATTGIFNFAQGAVSMLGAFAFWQLHVEAGMPTWLALALVLLVVAPAFGAAIELVVMRNLRDASEAVRVVVPVALLAACLGLGQWLWPPDVARPIKRFFPGESVAIGGVRVTWHEVLAFVLAVVVAIGLRVLLYGTRTGITMRAAVDDRALAELHGARPDRSALVAWGLGCSLAALAGILLAPLIGLAHLPLTLLVVNAYAAAMLGRLRSLPLTFAGAVVVGLLGAYASGYLPAGNHYVTGIEPAVPVLVLFVVLVALPSARLRGRSPSRTTSDVPRPSALAALVLAGVLVGGGIVAANILSETDSLKAARATGLAIVALSLIPLAGWAGQLCLCQMSFAAIGALAVAHFGGGPLALVIGAAVAAVVGAVVALPALRLTGIELALATAAFAVICDRWFFGMPDVTVGPLAFRFFNRSSAPVDRLHLPGAGIVTNRGQLIAAVVVLATLHLVVAALRRRPIADRMLAVRDSPAACATLGMDPVATKVQAFAISAAMAAVGGAVFAGTKGSITPSDFNLFQSLPLLLITVAGGIAGTGGALFAGTILGGLPIVAAQFPGLAGLLGLLPGTIGITLGRNPDGVSADLAHRLSPLRVNRAALVVGVGLTLAFVVGWATGAVTGWIAFVGGFVAPFAVANVLTARQPRPVDALDAVLAHRRFDADDIALLDRSLALDEVGA